MNQERGPSVHISAQESQSLIGRIPRLHHDVIQLIAKEIFHHAFIARLNLEEICQNADGSEAAVHHSGLEQPPDRFSRVAMLGDDSLQRGPLSHRRCVLRAQSIQAPLRLALGLQFDSVSLLSLSDFFCQTCDSLRYSLKFQSQLPTLPAKSFYLRSRSIHLCEQTLRFSVKRR